MFKEEKTSYLETIVKLVIIFTALFVVFILPFYWYIEYDNQGIAMYLVLFFLSSPLIAFAFKNFIYFKKDELKNTFLSKKTYVVFVFLINIYVFLTIGLSTLLESYLLIIFYAFSYLPVLAHYLKKHFSYLMVLLCSFSISFLLLINFNFSTIELEETYSYKYNKITSTIQLKDYAYQEFYGIRLFLIERKILLPGGEITYIFADGLLGYRVVKKYKFE